MLTWAVFVVDVVVVGFYWALTWDQSRFSKHNNVSNRHSGNSTKDSIDKVLKTLRCSNAGAAGILQKTSSQVKSLRTEQNRTEFAT